MISARTGAAIAMSQAFHPMPAAVEIPHGTVRLQGILGQPSEPCGVVLFAHGSGSGRLSRRNQLVAESLQRVGLATLLFDLLTSAEEDSERITRHLRFDIALLAQRLLSATQWVAGLPALSQLPIGYFGASTGAGAALMAAEQAAFAGMAPIAAVVSRGGRPDLAGAALTRVSAPTLLIVGGDDTQVIELNRQALAQIPAEKHLEIVPHAGHLFEEPGALEAVATLAAGWFLRHLCERRLA